MAESRCVSPHPLEVIVRRTILLLCLCIAFPNIKTVAAQELTVKSATAKAVDLEWRGAIASTVLERSSGHAFAKISAGNSGQYRDTSIDAFGTYQYRTNTNGKLSNVVTVGPPPAGITNAAPAPNGSAPENYGPATAVALDENGDPAIAFEWVDPNGDGDKSDTEIRFTHWDRATYKWTPPVRVNVTGPLNDQNVNPIALGCDRTSGAFAILIALSDTLTYATSMDHGATWKVSSLPAAGGGPHAVAMIITSGQAYAAANFEEGASYFTGSLPDAASWKAKPIPAGNGWKLRNNSNIAITADASGRIALAFYEDQQEGDAHRYALWRPESGEPSVITPNASTDNPDISLAFGAGAYQSVFAGQLDANDADHVVWYSHSADGSLWSKPIKLPIDGPRSTNAPLSIAVSSTGALTAAFGANSGSGPAACGAPTVSRSTNGESWITCGLGKAAGADFGPQPATLHVIEAPDDKAYVVWQEPSETKFKPGVLIWHER